jgi:hypothetical protein
MLTIDIHVMQQMLDQSPAGFAVCTLALAIQIANTPAFCRAFVDVLIEVARWTQRQVVSRGRSGS